MSAYRYRAYGLEIQAYCALPGLIGSEQGEPDVLVRRGRVDVPERETEQEQRRKAWVRDDEVIVRWKKVGSILVREGREIIVDPEVGIDERIPGVLVVGTAIGILLHQRGLLTLHASAVAVDGGAVAFAGGKGAGKSTTASAFCERGYRFMADDIAALEVGGEGDIRLLPGGPGTKLTKAAASALRVNETERAVTRDERLTKQYHDLDGNFEREILPLRRIYILDHAGEGSVRPVVEVVRGREAIMELMTHSYALRFIGAQENGSNSLEQAAKVAQRVPVSRLRRTPDLTMLANIVECVENDLGLDHEHTETVS
jgi:hypothetical protein